MALGAIPANGLVAVVGSGTMGAGIAQVAAAAGHPVALYDTRTDIVPIAIGTVRQNFRKLAHKGKLSPTEAENAGSRLAHATDLAELRGAAIVIEAIAEDLDAKRELFRKLEEMVGADCMLVTNTSSLSVSAIAAKLQSPNRLVGMHFFNPAPVMELVEIVSGAATDPQIAAQAHATALAWKKTPVAATSTPGFIVNRIARPYYGEALILLGEQAADPATIDAVMRESGGFRMGPFQLMDLIGLDIGLAVGQSLFSSYFGDARYRPSFVQQEMVRAGYLGRKTGRGFYRYAEGAALPDPQTEPPALPPPQVDLCQKHPLDRALEKRLAGTGVVVRRRSSEPSAESGILVAGATVALTDGRTATECAHESGQRNFVVVDLALDYASAPRVAVAKAQTCDPRSYASVVGLFQAGGFRVSAFKDVPGLAVMRTVVMLANEAADAVNQGVATAPDVDTAMRKGVNYPRGPLAWADDLGLPRMETVLRNLACFYGGERYRISPLIRQSRWAGLPLHASVEETTRHS